MRWLRLTEPAGIEERALLLIFASHIDEVTSVAFSPDGTKVLTGSVDRTARLWEVANGQLPSFGPKRPGCDYSV